MLNPDADARVLPDTIMISTGVYAWGVNVWI